MSEAANHIHYEVEDVDIDSKMEVMPNNNLEEKVETVAIENEYKIYDLSHEQDRELFANSLIQQSFAFIQIPDKHKSSFHDLFTIFETLFQSKESLECEENTQYIGYTSTPNIKESLWFHLDSNNQLFPSLKNKNHSTLYESNNYKKVIKAFSIYNDIASDTIQSILQNVCNDKESYLKCQKNLFPINSNDKNYQECAVYHKYRKLHDLNLNNLAAIHYYHNHNKKPYKYLPLSVFLLSLLMIVISIQTHYVSFTQQFITIAALISIIIFSIFLMKSKAVSFILSSLKNQSDNNDVSSNKNSKIPKDPCANHIDYTLITLIIANESGLTVYDKHKHIHVDVNDVIKSHNKDRKDVIAVITGLTGAFLTDNNPIFPVSCRHSVKHTFDSDRISFPLFCYADPNGIIDTSLIKNRVADKMFSVSTLLAKEMRPSINF